MKKLLPLIILIFALAAFPQTKNQTVKPSPSPSPQNKAADIVELIRLEKISSLLRMKRYYEEEIKRLSREYSNSAMENMDAIKNTKLRIAEIDAEVTKLSAEKGFTLIPDNIPSNDKFLLKILIIQNQRIIELLEKNQK